MHNMKCTLGFTTLTYWGLWTGPHTMTDFHNEDATPHPNRKWYIPALTVIPNASWASIKQLC